MKDALSTMADLLLELERELRAQELWADEPPALERLASPTPFAADSLVIEEWLQWIFIPRIKELIEADAALPATCNISDYAEEAWKQTATDTDALLQILQGIDRHITDN